MSRHIFALVSLAPSTLSSQVVFPTTTPESPYRFRNFPLLPRHPEDYMDFLDPEDYRPSGPSNFSVEISRSDFLPYLVVGLALAFLIPWLLIVGDKVCKLELSRLFRPLREKCAPAFYALMLLWCLVAFLMFPICLFSWCKNKVWEMPQPWPCPCRSLAFKTATYLSPPLPAARSRLRHRGRGGRNRGLDHRHSAPPPYDLSVSSAETAVEMVGWDPIDLEDRPPDYHSIPLTASNSRDHSSPSSFRNSEPPRAHMRG